MIVYRERKAFFALCGALDTVHATGGADHFGDGVALGDDLLASAISIGQQMR